MWNHIDTLITKKYLNEDKKIEIRIIKEEDGIIINIHGTKHCKTTLQQDIIIYHQPLQIGEATTKYMESKEKKLWIN